MWRSALSQDGSLQCPSCKTIYGEKTGTQPRGKMEVFSFQVSLPGHEDCGTILIVYNIPHGIQVRALAKRSLLGSAWNQPSPSSLSPVTVGMSRLPSSCLQEPGDTSAGAYSKLLGSKDGPQLLPKIGKASWRQRRLSWICTWQKVKCISRKNTCVEGQDPLGATGQDGGGASSED